MQNGAGTNADWYRIGGIVPDNGTSLYDFATGTTGSGTTLRNGNIVAYNATGGVWELSATTAIAVSTDDIINQSLVSGATATDALNSLQSQINAGGTTRTLSVKFNFDNPSSTIPLGQIPANGCIYSYQIRPLTPAVGGNPSIAIGTAGNPTKYLGTNTVDLSDDEVFEDSPNADKTTAAENLIVTFSAGGASAGTFLVIVDVRMLN